MSDKKPMFRYIKAVIPLTIISAHLGKHVPAGTMIFRDSSGELTTDDIGLTPEQAAGLRMMFGAMADDWDDPSMDAYDEL